MEERRYVQIRDAAWWTLRVFVLCKCACLCGGKACGHVHARAEQRQVLIPMMSRDTMRRVVVWISGRGRAANGMVYGSREDGGDPCSVRVTRSHAMLATRALCRLRARVIAILAKTHIVESWASKGSCPQIACFSTTRTLDYEPGG